MEDNEEGNTIIGDQNENETKDLFEKYNTYFTIILILSYLDKKSLLQLMPLKKRFYELISDVLISSDEDIYLPMFNRHCNNIGELFITYYIYVIKVIKKDMPDKDKRNLKLKLVFNILKRLEGNTLKIEPDLKNNLLLDVYGLGIFKNVWRNDGKVEMIHEPRFFPDFVEDLENDNLTLENFTSKYGDAFKNNKGDLLYQTFNEPILLHEYCEFISYVLKLYKNVFNEKHKLKFEVIELGKDFFLNLFSIYKKNNEYFINVKENSTNVKGFKYNASIGNNTLCCSELNIKYGNSLNQSLLYGCDFINLKILKLKNTSYIANKRQILEYIDFNDMIINYDSFWNLLQINKNTLKTIIFNNVSLFNKIVNDIQLQKMKQIIPYLKHLVYVKLNLETFPVKLILLLFIYFLENFNTKTFKFFSLICKKAEIKNISDIPGNFFHLINVKEQLTKDKFKFIAYSKGNNNQKGFFVEIKDLKYQLTLNNNKKIICSLNILNNNKKYLKNKQFQKYISIK